MPDLPCCVCINRSPRIVKLYLRKKSAVFNCSFGRLFASVQSRFFCSAVCQQRDWDSAPASDHSCPTCAVTSDRTGEMDIIPNDVSLGSRKTSRTTSHVLAGQPDFSYPQHKTPAAAVAAALRKQRKSDFRTMYVTLFSLTHHLDRYHCIN